MSDVLVDSNVLLDIFTEDSIWRDWSESILDRYDSFNSLCINPIIYAEISIRFDLIEELEDALNRGGFQWRPLPREALFLAGKAFLLYRKRQGIRRSPLPDFFIGAHAAVARVPLLTRDATRFKSYFPTVTVISPENSDLI